MSRRTPQHKRSSARNSALARRNAANSHELRELRSRLAEAEETIRAIRSGDVDAVVVTGPQGERVYTLRGAEYAYRALVEAMNEGAATVSSDGIILYCNHQVSILLQTPLEKIIGGPVKAFIAEAHKVAFASLFRRALRGNPCKSEVLLQLPDGSTAPVHVSLSRLPAEDLAAVCVVITDLREHKRRDELIAAGNLAQSILESAAEPIAVCNPEGRVVLTNEAFRRLCGARLDVEHFDQLLPLEITSPDPATGSVPMPFSISMALRGEGFRAREVMYRHPSGRITWLLLTIGGLSRKYPGAGCVVTLVDVTHKKSAEQALLRSEKLAATGQLAATIAHEINNPLTAVFNLLYLIEQEPSPEQVQKLVTQAVGELSRVTHIARQTLAFYRESKQPEKISIAEVLDDILALFRKEFEARNVSIEKNYEIPGEVLAYPGEMRQVFSNLVRNSLEAVAEGGQVRMLVRRTRHAGKGGIGVFISDNGSGIRPEVRRKIFEPFFTTKAEKGTGLGLWVAKDLVEKHSGVIQVRSSSLPGHVGTCFYVFLPAAPKREEARVIKAGA